LHGTRNRKFESIPLQRRVACEPEFLDQLPSQAAGAGMAGAGFRCLADGVDDNPGTTPKISQQRSCAVPAMSTAPLCPLRQERRRYSPSPAVSGGPTLLPRRLVRPRGLIDEQPAEKPGTGADPSAEPGIAPDSTKERAGTGADGRARRAQCQGGEQIGRRRERDQRSASDSQHPMRTISKAGTAATTAPIIPDRVRLDIGVSRALSIAGQTCADDATFSTRGWSTSRFRSQRPIH